MLNPLNSLLNTSQLEHPVLIIVIDTEEEFDWNQPFDRQNTQIKNIAYQEQAQKIFAKYGIKPTYVIDYPVASQAESINILKDYYDNQLCDIGAHLHPWVSPPFNETVNNYNSFPGNLSYEQEFEKLKKLTDTIADNFGFSPTIYKAGRYGVGKHTSDILKKLGYKIDCSIVPNTDFSNYEGPDFTHIHTNQPYWVANKNLLEVPLSVDYVGYLSKAGNKLNSTLQNKQSIKLKLPGVLSRLKLFERIRLTPEGHSLDDLKRLTLSMVEQNQKVFCLTYHSSTLMPGGSPYVKNTQELNGFLQTIEDYLEFFSNHINGQFSCLKYVLKPK